MKAATQPTQREIMRGLFAQQPILRARELRLQIARRQQAVLLGHREVRRRQVADALVDSGLNVSSYGECRKTVPKELHATALSEGTREVIEGRRPHRQHLGVLVVRLAASTRAPRPSRSARPRGPRSSASSTVASATPGPGASALAS